jgi:hypothetical protein
MRTIVLGATACDWLKYSIITSRPSILLLTIPTRLFSPIIVIMPLSSPIHIPSVGCDVEVKCYSLAIHPLLKALCNSVLRNVTNLSHQRTTDMYSTV